MFLHFLSLAEKQALLALAREMVRADDRIADAECAELKSMCAEMGLDPKTIVSQRDRAARLACFASRRSKVIALLELLVLANSDRDFGAKEREFLRSAAASLGFQAAELKALASWVDRHDELAAEAEAFMKEQADTGETKESP